MSGAPSSFATNRGSLIPYMSCWRSTTLRCVSLNRRSWLCLRGSRQTSCISVCGILSLPQTEIHEVCRDPRRPNQLLRFNETQRSVVLLQQLIYGISEPRFVAKLEGAPDIRWQITEERG